jgi:copper chaperone NosL
VPELSIMPWLVGSVIVGGLIVAALGSRLLLLSWAGGFAGVAAVGLADFWRWTYDYGHNLDYENAIIKVPGMTYQPPLIGTKQLLNFTASSWPAAGGWLAFAAMALVVAAVVIAWRAKPGRSRAALTAVTSAA